MKQFKFSGRGIFSNFKNASNTLMLLFLSFFSVITPPQVACAETNITIGWIGPLTGDAAALGVDSVEVARQVFDDFNQKYGAQGVKINFVVEDDQYQTSKTVSAYNKLVKVDGAKIIFVLTYGGLMAIADRAQKDNVILVDPLDCDDEIASLPSNTFCIAKRTEDLGNQNALHAVKHGNSPAAIIYFDGDPFPVKVAKATKDTLEKNTVKVTSFDGVSSGNRDFRSILIRIKRQDVKSLFIYGYDDFGLVLKQARDLGISAAFYSVPGAGVNNPGFNAGAGEAINGIFAGGWFAPRTEAYKAFLTNYKKVKGREPILEVSTVPTHDAAKLLSLGIEKLFRNSSFDIDPIREYLYGVKNYQGLSGNITIDSDGAVRTLSVGMYSFSHGEFSPAN